MRRRRPKGYWYLPGRLYDLAFSGLFRGARRRIAWTVEADGLNPWLDVCCGTGDQFRRTRGPGVGLDKSFGFVRYAAARTPRATFVCGDASRLPFRAGAFRSVSVSMGLHDKSPELRRAIMSEVRRVLDPGGRLVAVDFERPLGTASRAGTLVTRAIERLAGRAHYENGRDFLRRGGLRAFLRENGFVEVVRHDLAAGSISLVVARAEGDNACDPPPGE
jgi:ubiquinone/menaquinone biosynthesis C-methylase UbiE